MEITFWETVAGLCAVAFISFVYNLYQVRIMVRRVKTVHGIDILPHSFLFGHLLEIDKVMRKCKFPPKVHTHWLPLLFLQEYPELASKGILYLDIWPISEPLLSIWNVDLLTQVSDANFPKAKLMKMETGPVTGSQDLLTLEGAEWKRARAVFNPGFAAKNLLSLVPQFVEEIEIFKQKLSRAAESREVVKLENLTIQLAVDVISRAVLGISLNSQMTSSPLLEIMMAQIPLLYNSLDFKKAPSPIRYIKLWFYRRRFRDLLLPYINRAIEEDGGDAAKTKTVLKLALKEVTGDKNTSAIPRDFVKRTVGHFWMFLFAGHDTTAITLGFAYYMLSRNPDKAAALRAEHDRVLGTDPARAADLFKTKHTLVNQLPYTTAVFKETLRLWAPVSGGVRSSPPGFFVVHPDTGERFPTHSWMINNAGAILHRMEEYWPRPHEFLPERWLVTDPKDPLYPRKGTFRPFEAGLRNCIGQELVGMEIRLVLALTAREFEVEDQYPDDGPTFWGERACSVEIPENVATAHALDQMPVIIRSRRKGWRD